MKSIQDIKLDLEWKSPYVEEPYKNEIVLDGIFTLKDLERIIAYMKEKNNCVGD